MLTAGDALSKTLALKKLLFGAKKIALDVFFLLTAGDALMVACVPVESKDLTSITFSLILHNFNPSKSV